MLGDSAVLPRFLAATTGTAVIHAHLAETTINSYCWFYKHMVLKIVVSTCRSIEPDL